MQAGLVWAVKTKQIKREKRDPKRNNSVSQQRREGGDEAERAFGIQQKRSKVAPMDG